MSQKMKQLVVHTTDTPFNREVTPDDLTLWHMGARHYDDGIYSRFLGRKMFTRGLKGMFLNLPSGEKVPAEKTNGRGWTIVGYSDMITARGELINLVPYTFDDTIDSFEITNGASGYNSNSRHVVLVGGWSKDGKYREGRDLKGNLLKPEAIYTKKALKQLREYIDMQKSFVPDIDIVGHNELSNKTCPNFDVQKFLHTI